MGKVRRRLIREKCEMWHLCSLLLLKMHFREDWIKDDRFPGLTYALHSHQIFHFKKREEFDDNFVGEEDYR